MSSGAHRHRWFWLSLILRIKVVPLLDLRSIHGIPLYVLWHIQNTQLHFIWRVYNDLFLGWYTRKPCQLYTNISRSIQNVVMLKWVLINKRTTDLPSVFPNYVCHRRRRPPHHHHHHHHYRHHHHCRHRRRHHHHPHYYYHSLWILFPI